MTRKFGGSTLVMATHNDGKLKELQRLIGPLGFDATSSGALGLLEPEETEDSFEGNARIKAHAASKATGQVALADDSGLMVDALDGQPGVYTADWAETGHGRDFPMAMGKVRDALDARATPEPWIARFISTLCLAWPDGHDEIVVGTAEGHLIWPPRGSNGFGCDPMFVPAGFHQTFGEMRPEEKDAHSHRTKAFRNLLAGPLSR